MTEFKKYNSIENNYNKDFLNEHSGSYAGLEKSEQKIFNRHLNKFSVELIKNLYISN
jgi:hypothetical protein